MKSKSKDRKTIIFFILVGIAGIILSIGLFSPPIFSKIIPYRLMVVVSPSMEPKLKVMDAVIVQSQSPNSLEVGDIITFKHDLDNDGSEEYITHYLAVINESTVRTKPAVTPEIDPWIIPKTEIEGKVVARLPSLGYVLVPIYNNAVPLLLITNIIVWITVYHIVIDTEEPKETESHEQ